jgi:hypothetical protein
MAVINIQSEDIAGLTQFPKIIPNSLNRSKSRKHFFRIPATAVLGDINSTIDLALLPQGDVRLFLTESKIWWTAFGAARLLDIGHRAYEAIDGSIIAAAANLFDDDVDVSAASNAAGVALGSDFVLAGTLAKTQRFLSAKGVMVFATVTGGTIPAGTIIEGFLEYAEL